MNFDNYPTNIPNTAAETAEDRHLILSLIDANSAKAPRNAFFHVAPRYTCGSPAMIDEPQAIRIAASEVEARRNHLTGVFGMGLRLYAEQNGLGNIAYARWEKGSKVWRLDLLTGETFMEPKRLDWTESQRLKELRNISQHYNQCLLELPSQLCAEQQVLEHRDSFHR